mmetsp:Transcript_44786/g.129451  ORF Transcript_44786/g.129451 Transcript_44786/m.129451 type:complete len:339 (-) Transcript_44786:153-1169(-)
MCRRYAPTSRSCRPSLVSAQEFAPSEWMLEGAATAISAPTAAAADGSVDSRVSPPALVAASAVHAAPPAATSCGDLGGKEGCEQFAGGPSVAMGPATVHKLSNSNSSTTSSCFARVVGAHSSATMASVPAASSASVAGSPQPSRPPTETTAPASLAHEASPSSRSKSLRATGGCEEARLPTLLVGEVAPSALPYQPCMPAAPVASKRLKSVALRNTSSGAVVTYSAPPCGCLGMPPAENARSGRPLLGAFSIDEAEAADALSSPRCLAVPNNSFLSASRSNNSAETSFSKLLWQSACCLTFSRKRSISCRMACRSCSMDWDICTRSRSICLSPSRILR